MNDLKKKHPTNSFFSSFFVFLKLFYQKKRIE